MHRAGIFSNRDRHSNLRAELKPHLFNGIVKLCIFTLISARSHPVGGKTNLRNIADIGASEVRYRLGNRHAARSRRIEKRDWRTLARRHRLTGESLIPHCRNCGVGGGKLEEASRAVGRARLFSRQKELEDGVFLRGDAIIARHDGAERQVMTTADIKLPGVHNIENYMAAIAAVDGLVPDEVIRDFAREFGGVEHRIELIRTRNGVRWYNDSIASSPSRTIAGLNSFPGKVILIAGGKDKGIPYDALGPVVNDHVKLLLLCGATAGVIRKAVEQAENYTGLEIIDVADYQEAVSLADSRAAEGDVVILSPASTSFDRFKNFMERGKAFKTIVNQLP